MTAATNPDVRTGSPMPGAGHNYFRTLRDGKPRWWKPLVIAVVVVVVYLIINVVLSILAFALDAAIRGGSMTDAMTGRTAMTPLLFASALLSLAALLPISMLLHRLLFGSVPLGSIFSVVNRFRWAWFGRAALIAMIMIAAASAVLALAAPELVFPGTGAMANPIPWLLVVVLIMPVQAAAEEITFRGLFGRGMAGLFARAGVGTVIGLVVSSVAFGAGHAAQDPWLIIYYVSFGAVLGVLAWRTGGIEASIAVHAGNNLIMGVIGVLFDNSIENGIDRSMGAGSPQILIYLGTLILTSAVLIMVARRTRVASVEVPTDQSPAESKA